MRSKFLWEYFLRFFVILLLPILEVNGILGSKYPPSAEAMEIGGIRKVSDEVRPLKTHNANKEFLVSNNGRRPTFFEGNEQSRKKSYRKTKAMDLETVLLFRSRRTKRELAETKKSFSESIAKIIRDAFTRTINRWIQQINQLRELVGVRVIKLTSPADTQDLTDPLNIFNITGKTPLFLIAGGIKNNFTQPTGNETYLTMSFEEILADSDSGEKLPNLNALVFENGQITIEDTANENSPELKSALSQAIAAIINDVFTRAFEKWFRTINSLRERVGVRIIKITSSDDTTKLAEVLNIFNISRQTPLFLIAGGIKNNFSLPSGNNQTFTSTTLDEMFGDPGSSNTRLIEQLTHGISKRSVVEEEPYSTKLKFERKLRKHRQHYAPAQVKVEESLTGYSKPLVKIPMNHRRRLGYARSLIFQRSSKETSSGEDSSSEDTAINSTLTTTTTPPVPFFHTVPNVPVAESNNPVQTQGYGLFSNLNTREVVKSERKTKSSEESGSSESDENEGHSQPGLTEGSQVDVISQNNEPSSSSLPSPIVQGVIDNNESPETGTTTTTEETQTMDPSITGTSLGDLFQDQENNSSIVEVDEEVVVTTQEYSQGTSLGEEKETSINSLLFPVEEERGRSKNDQNPEILSTIPRHDDFNENPISNDKNVSDPASSLSDPQDHLSLLTTSDHFYNHSVPLPDSTNQNFDDSDKKAEFDETLGHILEALKNILEPERVKVEGQEDEIETTTTVSNSVKDFNPLVEFDNSQPEPVVIHPDPIPLGSLVEETNPTLINLPIIPPSPAPPYEQINPYVSKPTFTTVTISHSHRPAPVYTPHLLASWLSPHLKETPLQPFELHQIVSTGHKFIIKNPPHHTQDALSAFILEVKKAN